MHCSRNGINHLISVSSCLLVSGSTTSVIITVDNSHKTSSTLATPSTCICTINYTTARQRQNACYVSTLFAFVVLSFLLSRIHQTYIRPASSSPQPCSLFSFLSVNHVTKFSCLNLSRKIPSPSRALSCFSSRSLSQPQFQEAQFLVEEYLPPTQGFSLNVDADTSISRATEKESILPRKLTGYRDRTPRRKTTKDLP